MHAVVLLIVPKEDRRRFMMMAWELGMTKGEYVFYTIEMLPEENVLNPQDVWASNDGQNVVAKQAFEAVFHVCRLRSNDSKFTIYFVGAAVAVDSSHVTALSRALWCRFSPPSNFVNGHVSTMWFTVCCWPQSQEGDWTRPHLCNLARHGP